MFSVHQTAAEDTETPTTKVIFLDAPGRVAEAGSGNVSEDKCSLINHYFDLSFAMRYSPFSPCVVCACHGRRGALE